MVLDFGRVPTNRTATATFVVENMGSSKLVGKATVPAPFKIVAGGDYSLKANEAQMVTITYKPTRRRPRHADRQVHRRGGAKATVTGNQRRVPRKLFKR